MNQHSAINTSPLLFLSLSISLLLSSFFLSGCHPKMASSTSDSNSFNSIDLSDSIRIDFAILHNLSPIDIPSNIFLSKPRASASGAKARDSARFPTVNLSPNDNKPNIFLSKPRASASGSKNPESQTSQNSSPSIDIGSISISRKASTAGTSISSQNTTSEIKQSGKSISKIEIASLVSLITAILITITFSRISKSLRP